MYCLLKMCQSHDQRFNTLQYFRRCHRLSTNTLGQEYSQSNCNALDADCNSNELRTFLQGGLHAACALVNHTLPPLPACLCTEPASVRTLHQCQEALPGLLWCPSNHSISGSSAWYGRPGPTHCPGPSGDCPGVNVTAGLQKNCNTNSTCVVGDYYRPVLNDNDPCYGVLKYVEVNYTCVAGECLRHARCCHTAACQPFNCGHATAIAAA
jgi:hypothetical protein